MAKESKALGFGLQSMMDNTKTSNWLSGILVIIFSIIATFAITGNIDQITSFIGLAFDSGNTYFISPAGSDTFPGTETQPFKTFAHAMTVLIPGDTLVMDDGIYKEQLKINKFGAEGQPITIKAKNLHKAVISPLPVSDPERDGFSTVQIHGNYINLDGIEVAQSSAYCIEVLGDNININNNKVHNCWGHGIITTAQNTTINNNQVYLSNIVNQDKSLSSGWGSAIKVKLGGQNTTITNNYVYNNYGEGIAVTRGVGATISRNKVYDNFSVNIYVDNSYNVNVDSNFSYCTDNTEFFIDGHSSAAFGMEEEYYDGWGAQLHDVSFTNNIAYNCYRGIYYWRSDVSGIGVENITIAHNTFVNLNRGSIYIESTPNDSNNIIENNIFSQQNQTFGYIEDTSSYKYGYNLFNIEPDSWTKLRASTNIYGSTNFESNPSYDANSFKLSFNNPAINNGTNLDITKDYFQGGRDSNPDIGAHEYGSTASLPTPTPAPTSTATPSPKPTPTSTPTPTPTSYSTPPPTPIIYPSPAPNTGSLNSAPWFLTNKMGKASYQKFFSDEITVADTNSEDALILTASGLPKDIYINSCLQKYNRRGKRIELTCTISGTANQRGTFYPTFTVYDNHGGTTSDTIKLTVR